MVPLLETSGFSLRNHWKLTELPMESAVETLCKKSGATYCVGAPQNINMILVTSQRLFFRS